MMNTCGDSVSDKVQVLVVDDSAFMRSAIKGMIKSDPELDVIATARDGIEAIEKIEKFRPDIVTLDIEMPRMNGLEALEIIMEKMPVPVLILSSLTTDSAEATVRALSLGAVDFICKDLGSSSLEIMNVEQALVGKIREIARRFKRHPATVRNYAPVRPPDALKTGIPRTHNVAVVAIGASTGGPKALHDVIPFLPKDFTVPVLIVQHMPQLFTRPFAERLASLSQLAVKEAEDGEPINPGTVYIGRGGIHLKARRIRSFEVHIELTMLPEGLLYRPSVDVMMRSVVEAYQGRCLGVIMTGMGNDGTEGLRALKAMGGKTLGQNEESCVVYGMPRSAAEAGVVDKLVPLSNLAGEIVNLV